MRRSFIVLPIVFAVLVVGALYGKYRLDHYEPSEYLGPQLPPPAHIARIGDTIAPQSLTDLQGSAITIGGSHPRAMLLHYWASWCLPCVQELPTYQAAQRRLDAIGVDVLTIAQDDREHAQEIADRQKFSLSVLIADGAKADPLLMLGSSTGSVPFNVVLDPDGKVTAQKLGVIAGGADGLVAWVAVAVQKK